MILQLGNVPKVYDAQTGLIAKPNESLSQRGTFMWGCAEWIQFHKGFVDYFMKGFSKTKVKYTQAQALELTKPIFLQHWNAFNPNCSSTAEFVNYFVSVGLSEIIKRDTVMTDAGAIKEADFIAVPDQATPQNQNPPANPNNPESKTNLMPLWIGLGVSGVLLLGYVLTRPAPAPSPSLKDFDKPA